MKHSLPRENFTTRDRRNSLFVRSMLLALLAIALLYALAATMGWLPPHLMPGKRHAVDGIHGVPSNLLRTDVSTIDPEPYLGKAIAGTCFRFIHSKHVALVTRPDLYSPQRLTSSTWTIPDQLSIQGEIYTITALEPTAFLYADGMTTISLPKTIKYLNNAHAFMRDELKTIEIRQKDADPIVLTKEDFQQRAHEFFPLPQEESTQP